MENNFLELIKEELSSVWEEAVQHRRYLHMNPEIGFDTQNTECYVKAQLESLDVELLPAKIGVLAVIHGRDHDRMVALRADMDALTIEEANEVPYRSQCKGKMHACGHDGHTAMLLAAAKILSMHKEQLPNDVLLIFQPAEEGPGLGGAHIMLEDMQEKGLVEKISNIFALHVFNDYPTGTIGVRYGSMAASTDSFDVTIIGKGGHAAQPQKCIDALSIGTKVITAMESYMSRRIDPFDQAIFSVGIFEAGTAKNIVAERARFAGTIRCQRKETRTQIKEDLKRMVNGICEGFGASCEIQINQGLPVLVNDSKTVDYSKAVAEAIVGSEHVQVLATPMMVAEDFAYFAEAIPASFISLGSANAEKGLDQPNHQARFDFDEEAMKVGILMLCGLAMNAGQ